MRIASKSISVIGTGAWGTALAHIMAEKGLPTTLWARREALAKSINETHKNPDHLPDIELSHNISATTDLAETVKNDIILMVTPAQAVRSILTQMKPYIRESHALILCSKGIEQETLLLMSDVAQEILPNIKTAILSGPNFAKDIAQAKPSATTLASNSQPLAETLQNALATPFFRPYVTTDIIGTQIAGALKNVIAIACGITKGLDFGESATASLITRGLSEITRLGLAMGAKPETFLGLCGVGDMMLTCSSEQSRNFSLGLRLGQGIQINDIMKSTNSVTEGVHTAKTCVALAKKHGVNMPICENIYACIHTDQPISEALKNVLNRPLSHETHL